MDRKSLDRISEAATALPSTNYRALTGSLLTARYCYDAISMSHGRPVRSADVATLVGEWRGEEINPISVRQILRALINGGLPIKSSTSRGYWLENGD